SVISSARPSSSRSDARGGCGDGGAALAARAVSSTLPPGAKRPGKSTAVSESRYVSRASVTSSGSSRLAALSNKGGASLPRLSAARRALELGGDVLVEARGRSREVPGAAIGVDLGIGRVSQRAMHGLPVLRRGRAIHGRADQRVTKRRARADREQPVGVGRR